MSGRFIFFQEPGCHLGSQNNSLDGQDGATAAPHCPNISVHGTPVRYEDDPTVKLLRNISEIWISFPLVIFGIFGNLLSLMVLCQPRQRQKLRTIIILLRTLAIFDILVLLSVFLLRTMRYIGPVWYLAYFTITYPYLYPVTYALRLINTWITVLLTVDRYVAVCRPLHAQRLCTVRRTYLQIGAVILLSVLFCVPRHFEYTIKYHSDGHYGFETTDLISNSMYTLVYRISLFLIVHYFVPTTVLVWLNSLVIAALRRSDAYRAANLRRLQRYGLPGSQTLIGQTSTVPGTAITTSAPSVTPSALQSTRGVTVVVVIVVCLCIACHMIAIIAQVFHALQTAFTDPVIQSLSFELIRRHVSQMSNVLVTLNSAINFVVYCMCSRTFRAVLISRILCCCPKSSRARRVLVCLCCCCWCCRGAPKDALMLRNGRSPPVGAQSSTVTNNSTRSMTNSIMLSVMPNRLGRKKDSLGKDDVHENVFCGASRNQHVS